MVHPAITRFKRTFLLSYILLLMVAGCSNNAALDYDTAGKTVSYTPGVPNFDIEAIATIRSDQPGIDLFYNIPYASLVFLSTGSDFSATCEVSVVLTHEGTDERVTRSWLETLTTSSYKQTQSYDTEIRQRRVNLNSGSWVVAVTLRDPNNATPAVRTQRVIVPGIQADQPTVSRIRMEGFRKGSGFEPVVAYHVPAGTDTLRAKIELYEASDEIQLEMRLLQFASDTSIARIPYWVSPGQGSLEWRGIDFGKADTLQKTTRTLRHMADEISIEFALPNLLPGNYRVEIEAVAKDENGEVLKNVLFQQRDLSIKHPDFPYMTTLRQLVDALEYITYEKELEHIKEATSEEEKKARFDAFWGGLIANKQVAMNVLDSYYSRIEQANLFFTGHKPGWQTDRGMVYIMMGAPLFTESKLDLEIWHYATQGQSALGTFTFERSQRSKTGYANYILKRFPQYEEGWQRAFDRWRSGRML